MSNSGSGGNSCTATSNSTSSNEMIMYDYLGRISAESGLSGDTGIGGATFAFATSNSISLTCSISFDQSGGVIVFAIPGKTDFPTVITSNTGTAGGSNILPDNVYGTFFINQEKSSSTNSADSYTAQNGYTFSNNLLISQTSGTGTTENDWFAFDSALISSNISPSADGGGIGGTNYLYIWNAITVPSHIWVKLNSNIPASGTQTIYLIFFAQSTNNYSPSGDWGAYPTLTSTYGQYDNGATVFSYYTNFAGTSLPSGWTATADFSGSVNNGLNLVSSSNQAGIYMSYALTNSQVYDIFGKSETGPIAGNAYACSIAITGGAGDACTGNGYVWQDQSGGYDIFKDVSGTYTSLVSSTNTFSANTFYVFSNSWASSTLALGQSYSSIISTTDSTYSSESYFALSTYTGNTAFNQWIRIRNAPPNNAMPSVSSGPITNTGGSLYNPQGLPITYLSSGTIKESNLNPINSIDLKTTIFISGQTPNETFSFQNTNSEITRFTALPPGFDLFTNDSINAETITQTANRLTFSMSDTQSSYSITAYFPSTWLTSWVLVDVVSGTTTYKPTMTNNEISVNGSSPNWELDFSTYSSGGSGGSGTTGSGTTTNTQSPNLATTSQTVINGTTYYQQGSGAYTVINGTTYYTQQATTSQSFPINNGPITTGISILFIILILIAGGAYIRKHSKRGNTFPKVSI